MTGFAPSFYFNQQSAGLGIWIATGTINGVQYNGRFVPVPKNATTQINLDANGNIVYGPNGLTPIAIVVSGQVVTSGNTVNSSPAPGAPTNYATFDDGIISVTDIRTFV